MTYFYDPDGVGFYDSAIKEAYDAAGTWPPNGVEISDKEHAIYSAQPPSWKRLGTVNGRPAWVDLPPQSAEDIKAEAESQKAALMAEATASISPLQDAVDLEIATDEEKALLLDWKKYRVLLMRVDTTAPDWPTPPGQQAS